VPLISLSFLDVYGFVPSLDKIVCKIYTNMNTFKGAHFMQCLPKVKLGLIELKLLQIIRFITEDMNVKHTNVTINI